MADLDIMDSDSIWIVQGNSSLLDPSTNILLTSNFYMFEYFDNFVIIKEVYRKANYLPLTSKLWGIWMPKFGLIFNEAFIWQRRRDLTGVEFRCGSLPTPPHIYMEPINGTKYQKIDGAVGDVWNELQNTMKFSSKIELSIVGSNRMK